MRKRICQAPICNRIITRRSSGKLRLVERPWSGRRDSNPPRPAWEAGILPLNYSRSNRIGEIRSQEDSHNDMPPSAQCQVKSVRRPLPMPGPGLRAIFRGAEVSTQLPLSSRELTWKQVDLPGFSDPPRECGHHLCVVVSSAASLLQGAHLQAIVRLPRN